MLYINNPALRSITRRPNGDVAEQVII